MLTIAGNSAAWAGKGPRCKGSPIVVGPCYTVHGRLTAHNGTPTFRIWVIGTKRVIGVSGRDDAPIPKELEAAIAAQGPEAGLFDYQAFGDYEVCPYTEERPGWMRFVCVEKATNIVMRRAGD